MRAHARYGQEPASVGKARGLVRETLAGVDDEIIDTVTLLVSELVTNSIRHAASAVELVVVRDPGEVVVEVTDVGAGLPVVRHPGPTETSGRGMELVETLSTRWGIQPHPDGKTTWFSVRDSRIDA